MLYRQNVSWSGEIFARAPLFRRLTLKGELSVAKFLVNYFSDVHFLTFVAVHCRLDVLQGNRRFSHHPFHVPRIFTFQAGLLFSCMDPITIISLIGTCSAITVRVGSLINSLASLRGRFQETEQSIRRLINQLSLFQGTVEELR